MPQPAPLEILVLANDRDDRPQLTAQALDALVEFNALIDFGPAAIFAPVRLRIRQAGRYIFDQSGPLSSVLYGLTGWGYDDNTRALH